MNMSKDLSPKTSNTESFIIGKKLEETYPTTGIYTC